MYGLIKKESSCSLRVWVFLQGKLVYNIQAFANIGGCEKQGGLCLQNNKILLQ